MSDNHRYLAHAQTTPQGDAAHGPETPENPSRRWFLQRAAQTAAGAAVMASPAGRMFVNQAEAAATAGRDVSRISPDISRKFKGYAFQGFARQCAEHGIIPIFAIERAQLIDARTGQNHTFFIPVDDPENAMRHMRIAYADYGALGDRLVVGKDIDLDKVIGSPIDCGEIAPEVLDVKTYLMATAGARQGVPALGYVLNSGKRSLSHQRQIVNDSDGRVPNLTSAHIGGFAFDGYMKHVSKEALYAEAKKMGLGRGIYPNFCHFDVCGEGRWFGADGAGNYYPAAQYAALEGVSLREATEKGKSNAREDDWFCRNLGVCIGSPSKAAKKSKTEAARDDDSGVPHPFGL